MPGSGKKSGNGIRIFDRINTINRMHAILSIQFIWFKKFLIAIKNDNIRFI